jgi:MFS superfamily sulfate permease-like transporter
MVTAWNMIEWRSLSYHLRTGRFDAAIVSATAIAAVGISIEFCVLIGVLMSFLLTVPRAGQMLITEFSLTGGRCTSAWPRTRPARASSSSGSRARCSSARPPRSGALRDDRGADRAGHARAGACG